MIKNLIYTIPMRFFLVITMHIAVYVTISISETMAASAGMAPGGSRDVLFDRHVSERDERLWRCT